MIGLFGSRVLETALGLAGVYLLLAMFCSTVNEWLAAALSLRARMLERAVVRLLGEAARDFYAHPRIQALMHDDAHPERIAAATFAQTVLDLAAQRRICLFSIAPGTEQRLEAAQKAIEQWFDDGMESLSRRYQRQVQLRTALLAAAATVGANADSLRLARALSAGRTAAEAIGWTGAAPVSGETFVGWLLTASAVSLGAPFWFDVARNLVSATRQRGTAEASK